jgi:hypothetical protein
MPCSPLKDNRRSGEAYLLHLQRPRISQTRSQNEASCKLCFLLVSFYVFSSTLKMEAIFFPENLVDFQRTTRRATEERKLFMRIYVFPLTIAASRSLICGIADFFLINWYIVVWSPIWSTRHCGH